MRSLWAVGFLLVSGSAAFAQGAPQTKIVSGVCQTVLNNTQSDSKPCDLNVGSDGYVPPGMTVRLRQVSAYCIGPVDRAIRMVRLDTQMSNAYTDMHNTFVHVMRREVRSPGLHAEYQGSQVTDVYAGPGLRILATVTAELGSLTPPIQCEIRFQGTVVP
jgi:hypothetical protein